ncbi:MAG: hypothetical protein ACOX1X_02995 [Dethiobacteria bacterium]
MIGLGPTAGTVLVAGVAAATGGTVPVIPRIPMVDWVAQGAVRH